MAYARGLSGRYGGDLGFAAVHPSGVYGRIPSGVAADYLDELDSRWADTGAQKGQRSLPSVLPWIRRLLPKSAGVGSADVLVQVSPHHLIRTDKVRRILAREDARFVCMVHDLIPIEYPEYARPGGAELHEARMTTVADLADAVIVNSEATGRSLERWIMGQQKAVPPIHAALLGTHPIAAAADHSFADGRPYFLCLGTIEPRKNHLLLLHLWRDMAAALPAKEIPRLVIIGRRGWENEQILDLLDRCPVLEPHVQEVNGCGDLELAAMIRGATALLMPSFAEGFGMPIAEALSVGTPVIASDIAAHREVGLDVPEYLDPLDGHGWRQIILDYAKRGPARQAQLDRLKSWNAPDWSDHMSIAAQVIEDAAK
nr:glycosyltransferase family 1 protein [Erythrobacter rubeus]